MEGLLQGDTKASRCKKEGCEMQPSVQNLNHTHICMHVKCSGVWSGSRVSKLGLEFKHFRPNSRLQIFQSLQLEFTIKGEASPTHVFFEGPDRDAWKTVKLIVQHFGEQCSIVFLYLH